MNISVPDSLAEEVRRREVPVSAVCQRALSDEVDRLRAADAESAASRERIIQGIIDAGKIFGTHIEPATAAEIAKAACGAPRHLPCQ